MEVSIVVSNTYKDFKRDVLSGLRRRLFVVPQWPKRCANV